MIFFKNFKKKRLPAFALSISLAVGGLSITGYAASYSRVSDGVYQMLDGTAVTGVVARGIDVSHWRGSIDWKKAVNDDVSFAMLGTRYSGQVDPYFREYAEKAHAAGIQVGAYIYSYALDVASAEAEADFVLDLIKDYPISFPIAYDLEDNSQAGLSPQQLAEMVNAFCGKIEAAGYYPLLYANDYWLANRIDMSMVNYDVWVARYNVKHAFNTPVMWQATSSGSIDGINGNVDINFLYQDLSKNIASDLWRTIHGSVYYYHDYMMQKNTWIDDGTGWFYLNASGQPATGWLSQKGVSYYLDTATGKMSQGWLKMTDGWHYFNGGGAMKTGWINDGSGWFYLNASGLMSTGWIQDGQNWYLLGNTGAMTTGWQLVNGSWYYLSGSGVRKTGWVGSDSAWYYLNPADGVMLSNTQLTIDNVLYQIDESGVCHAVIPEDTPAEDIPAGDPAGGGQPPAAEDTGIVTPGAANDVIVAFVPPLG